MMVRRLSTTSRQPPTGPRVLVAPFLHAVRIQRVVMGVIPSETFEQVNDSSRCRREWDPGLQFLKNQLSRLFR